VITTEIPLLEAASIAGGVQSLARHLRVPCKQLTSWLDGDMETPRTVLARAVDFIRATQSVEKKPGR
jgi:hypothetical protein